MELSIEKIFTLKITEHEIRTLLGILNNDDTYNSLKPDEEKLVDKLDMFYSEINNGNI